MAAAAEPPHPQQRKLLFAEGGAGDQNAHTATTKPATDHGRRTTTAGQTAQTKHEARTAANDEQGTNAHRPTKPEAAEGRQQRERGGQRRTHRRPAHDHHGGTQQRKNGKPRTEPRGRPRQEQSRNQKDKKDNKENTPKNKMGNQRGST